MSNSEYILSRQGLTSTDCRSVHSHGSISAWESVVGHDDPTVPINNCREIQSYDIPDSATIDSFVTQPEENRDAGDTVSDRESSQLSPERKGLRDQLSELDKTEKDWENDTSKSERVENIPVSRHVCPETVIQSIDSLVRSEKMQLLEIHSIDENEALDNSEGCQPVSPSETSSEDSTNSTTTNEIVRQVQKRLSKNDHLIPKRDFFDDNFRDIEQGQDEELAMISTELDDTRSEKITSIFSDQEPDESTWKIDLDNLTGGAKFEQMDGISQMNSMDEDSTIQEKKTCFSMWTRWIALAVTLLLVLIIIIIAVMILKTEESNDVADVSPSDVENLIPASSSNIPTSAPSTKESTQLPALLPTRQPSLAPSKSDPVLSQLLELSGSGLLEKETVQNMAYAWLVEDDFVKGNLATVEPDHIIQRYICALLYFALNGTNWNSQMNFLTTTSVCAWNDGKGKGVYCDGFGNVSRITIYGNNLGGKLPSEIGSLPFLKELRLRNNSIVGQMPATLSNLHEIQMLELSGNDLTGPIPELSPLQNDLYHLSINDNRVSGGIPESIGSLKGLLYFDIHGNSLTGSLPTSLGTLPRLVTLHASKNQLTGSIPSFDDNLGLLQVIDISNNEIGGQLDHFFSKDGPKRLAEVNFDSNALTGSIPASLDSYTSLTSISMAHNEFSGSLAPSFKGLKRLKRLLINHNLLTGEVPPGLAGIGSIAEFRIDHNQFDGNLDSHFCSPLNVPIYTTFAADCRGPNPEVICSCCLTCCDASLGCEDV